MKIAIFYHTLFYLGDPPRLLPNAIPIVTEQTEGLLSSGLVDAASYVYVGVNGAEESEPIVEDVLPRTMPAHFHGLQCRNELRTLCSLRQWVEDKEDWYVLYLHAKGATWSKETHKESPEMATLWRRCMMHHVVRNWRLCVRDLDDGADSVGCHWMTYPATPKGQSIWAGSFYWAKASFLRTLPQITESARVKLSGIDSVESRYEAEVWIGSGPRLPKVVDYHPNWNPGKVETCRL